MTSRLLLAFLLVLFINNSVFSQKNPYANILPKDIDARPILDSINYLPDSLKQPVIDILKAKNFDFTKCFVEKEIELNKEEKTISIIIWDVDDLKKVRDAEKSNKEVSLSSYTYLYSGAIVYDIKTRTARFYCMTFSQDE